MKKTILFIITKSETGGAQKFVSEQIRCLSNTKSWNCLLATNTEGWLTQSVENTIHDKKMLLDTKIANIFSISYLIKLIRFIKKNKPDLIIANSANGGLYGRLAGVFTKTKVIYVSHGWSSIYNGGKFKFIFNFIERLLSNITASILCVSEKDKVKAIEIINITPRKIKVIPNSILAIENSRHQHVADILTVCRLAPPKRIDVLIEAMALLPEFNLHIVGDGPLRSQLEKMIIDRKLHNIKLCGYQSNFQGFGQYKIFCLISDSEGMPMSAIEAMSCKLPLILSNVGGCPEVIHNNGILVSNTAHHISESIKKIFTEYKILSENSEKLFKSKFDLNNNIFLFESYYLDIISLV